MAKGGTTFNASVATTFDALLAYDFDNGMPLNDAFGFRYGLGLADTGLFDTIANAVINTMAAEGDSGGPAFLDLIAVASGELPKRAGQLSPIVTNSVLEHR